MKSKQLTHFFANMGTLAVVEGDGFKQFVAAFNPTYWILSRGHITTVLQKIYVELKVNINDELSSVTFITPTTDH